MRLIASRAKLFVALTSRPTTSVCTIALYSVSRLAPTPQRGVENFLISPQRQYTQFELEEILPGNSGLPNLLDQPGRFLGIGFAELRQFRRLRRRLRRESEPHRQEGKTKRPPKRGGR